MVSTLFSGLNKALIARLVLLGNHIIASEPVAVARLKPYAGRMIEFRLLTKSSNSLLTALASGWPDRICLQVTPAGLLDWNPEHEAAGGLPGSLTVTIEVPDPVNAFKLILQREKPAVTIDGDAGLAEAVSWLMKNLRWDAEDDLARWLGAPPIQVLKTMAQGVRDALSRWLPGQAGASRHHAGR